MPVKQLLKDEFKIAQKDELADAHCHIDLFPDMAIIRESIAKGVLTIIADGIDTKSNMRVLELSDNINIFPAIGIDPESCLKMTEEEIDFNIGLIKENSARLVAIGEIGLDYLVAKDEKSKAKQKKVFRMMLDLANQLDLPVSVHARESVDDVIGELQAKNVRKAHFHFFEGDVDQAKRLASLGYYISIPPIKSGKRKRAAAAMPIEMIMAETDSPIVGKTPADVAISILTVAEARGIGYESACRLLSENTRRFFNIKEKLNNRKNRFIRQ